MSIAMHDDAERGDTLIEVLIALVIIGLTVTALLGGMAESIVASGQHRSHVTIDAVLKNFAEAAKYDIQFLHGSALFADCIAGTAPIYTLLGTPSPTNGPPGTAVTVFGTGYAPASPLTLTLNGVAPIAVISGSTSDANGNVALTFLVPPAATTGPITVADGAHVHSAVSTNSFVVTSGSPVATSSPMAAYHLNVASIACLQSGVQQVDLLATAPDGSSGSLSFVVIKP